MASATAHDAHKQSILCSLDDVHQSQGYRHTLSDICNYYGHRWWFTFRCDAYGIAGTGDADLR